MGDDGWDNMKSESEEQRDLYANGVSGQLAGGSEREDKVH